MKNCEELVEINFNPNWPYIHDHHYRILIIGVSGSGKTNVLLKVFDKIYLYLKDPFGSKYQLLILYYTILYYTILYYTIFYYTILYYTILYYTILYYTILYYTILYYTILCYTILYYTILYILLFNKFTFENEKI